MKRRTFYPLEAGTLSEAVALALPVSVSTASQLIASGAVYVNGKRRQNDLEPVNEKVLISVVLSEGAVTTSDTTVQPSALEVLFEDDRLLVVNKAAGVLAQPGVARSGDSLLDAATDYLQSPAGLVHRLDKDTSGVTVFGKNKASTRALAAAFREQTVQKQYLAVVDGVMRGEGVIALRLRRDPSRKGRFLAEPHGNGVTAETHYQVLKSDEVSVVTLFPKTGRTHQLRVHLSAWSHSIVGDRFYGGSDRASRSLLHAWRLTFEGQTFEAPIPADMLPFCEGL